MMRILHSRWRFFLPSFPVAFLRLYRCHFSFVLFCVFILKRC